MFGTRGISDSPETARISNSKKLHASAFFRNQNAAARES
jgi:hypothetical protein